MCVSVWKDEGDYLVLFFGGFGHRVNVDVISAVRNVVLQDDTDRRSSVFKLRSPWGTEFAAITPLGPNGPLWLPEEAFIRLEAIARGH